MFSWFEACLLTLAIGIMAGAFMPQFRTYRPLFCGSSVLLLTAAIFPRSGNLLGEYLFGASAGGLRLPVEILGVAWWVLGAWLIRSFLDLILRRTVFPNDDQPHAKRLFADLGSALVYVVAFIGIMETVLKQSISGVLAASGVFAIVLGLALQNTLADVFSGLAINMERPFEAGDWITVKDGAEGQVMEINWRATRVKTAANDVAAIPNSVVARSIVVKHRVTEEHVCSINISIDHIIPPVDVIAILLTAARGCPGIVDGNAPAATARRFTGSFIDYELMFLIEDYTHATVVQSEVIRRVADGFAGAGIRIGTAGISVPVVRQGGPAAGTSLQAVVTYSKALTKAPG
jgi:small-conductance mechanosensitive channel